MNKLQEAIGLGLVLGVIHGLLQPAYSVPVVPNFTQGSMTSHTETTSKVTETINSMDYNTGYQYSATGSGVEPTSGTLSPTRGNINVTIEGFPLAVVAHQRLEAAEYLFLVVHFH